MNDNNNVMLVPDIIIPTCKDREQVMPLLGIVSFFSDACSVIATCTPASAAINRNKGLDSATSDIVIMIDDDTGGFYAGWWRDLIMPLIKHGDISMVSARLVKADGSPAPMMHGSPDLVTTTVDVKYAPSACIAFWRDDLRFDEGYIGSGFEDTDFCEQLKKKHPESRFVINNKCRIIHHNEQKNQHGRFFEANKARYENKWNRVFKE